ncbi:XRE family transcriptional regulator [Pseudoflavonifractor sp. 60]|uniref:helix-turn-helix transcriptional regulator n=1 Tax=Pseudoflavonifractor sp. 60 TaxID=2304576 RepID=UPI0013686C7A|nr:helix-turn-helix transcriptional regulator [Pseudoflavonifractor sp. 60]NBI67089.1 XRE family transcriptional regulator [Pseudoflavonifractor sp. 60]
MVNSVLQIRDARECAGISQDDLAAKMKVSRQTVSRWETGSARPSADNLAKLSQLLGVSADVLLGLRPFREEETELTSPAEIPEELPPPVEIPEEQPPAKKAVSRRVRGLLLVLLAALLLAAGIAIGALLFGQRVPDAVPTSKSESEVVTSSGEQPEASPESEKDRPLRPSELDVSDVDPATVIYGKLLPPLFDSSDLS